MNIKSFKHYHKYLDFKYCLAKFFSDILKDLHLKNLSVLLNNIFQTGLQKYLQLRYIPIIRQAEDEIKTNTISKSEFDGNIFVCWFQGMQNAPELVRQCYENLKKNANGHKITLLTNENVFEIVKLPDHVLKKYQEGKITKTHITNLIRTSLLYLYGDLWIDSTILATRSLSEKIFSLPFYTIKKQSCSPYYIPNGKWTSYFMAGKKGCQFGHVVRSVLFAYWKDHDELIDYFMYDHIINMCYDNSSIVRELIDAVPYNNPGCDFFKGKYNQKLNQSEWDSVTKDTSLFKLSYKENIDSSLNNTYYTSIITPSHLVICIGKIIHAASAICCQEAA